MVTCCWNILLQPREWETRSTGKENVLCGSFADWIGKFNLYWLKNSCVEMLALQHTVPALLFMWMSALAVEHC
jgi:hypothetical protein